MSKPYIVLICLLALPMSLYARTADINLPALIKICQSFDKAVTDVNIEFDVEFSGQLPKDLPENCGRFVGPQKNYLTAIKPFERFYRLTQILVTENTKGNRMVATTLDASNGTDRKISFCAPMDDKKNLNYSISTPLGFTIFHRHYESETLLDALKNYKLVLDPNISKVNDFNAIEVICVTNNPYIPDLGATFRVMSLFFSVDHNYKIVKIVEYYNGSAYSASNYNVTKLKNLGNGIWFPVKGGLINEAGPIHSFTTTKVAINQGLTKKNLLDTPAQDSNSPPKDK
jgi:hypothetical protein